MDRSENDWHSETISEDVEQTLDALQEVPIAARFYLARGTGLALQLGHRRSVDLDFFLSEDFDVEFVVQQIQGLRQFALVSKSPGTIYANIGAIKVGFIAYVYPVLFPLQRFHDASVADPRDIGCMKLSAIASRGTRRDFIDLYVLAQRYGLDQLLTLFQNKYSQAHYSMVHVLKSLAYFEDAERDPMPDMLIGLSWPKVREYFRREVAKLL